MPPQNASLITEEYRRDSSNWFWLKVGNSLCPQGPQLPPLCAQQTHHRAPSTSPTPTCTLHRLLSCPHQMSQEEAGHYLTHPRSTEYHRVLAQLGRSCGPLPTQLCLDCVLLSICLPPASGFLLDGSSRPFRHCSIIAKEAYVCFLVFSFVFLTPQVFH